MQDTKRTQWHTMSTEAVRETLEVPEAGLNREEVKRRLEEHGANILPETEGRPIWLRLLAQFNNVLIYVLMSAVLVTALLGHWLDTAVIFAVVLVQGVVGFIQEGRAEKALAAIRHMLAPRATVLRDGQRLHIDASDLVPGDVLLLEPGDRVPADIRLDQVHGLSVDESMLTGESIPVEKALETQPADAALGDRLCLAYSGTLVRTGTARGVVVATGLHSEIGRISGLLSEVAVLQTPLTQQMNRFSRYLSLVIVLAGLGVFLLGWQFGDRPLADLFMAVVALTVSAIPEGLPAILTITLAIGVQRMANRKAVVRRMPAIETLGAVSIICTDKTGTLTRNEMMVAALVLDDQIFPVSGDGYDLGGDIGAAEGAGGSVPAPQQLVADLAQAALLCNDARLDTTAEQIKVVGDPMEAALLVLAAKAGLDLNGYGAEWPRQDEVPFDSDLRYMATLNHDHHGQARIFVKGAPERVMALCEMVRNSEGSAAPLDPERWQRHIDKLAGQGLRILALAAAPAPSGSGELNVETLGAGLELIGLVGLLDPPRQEAMEAIAECRQAGIEVKMITGDHAVTARAIAEKLGLRNTREVASGKDIDALDDASLVELAQRVDVFARTSPEHKLRLVQALQSARGVVAMTGDGVNDSPALKRADVGIAMGQKGSAAAREASDIVLLDDNFATLAAAVREGRTVYTNLKKAISFLLPINGGEAASLIVALLLGLALPITALQILWVNLVSSVVLAMGLAFEPAENDVMHKPPRPADEGLLDAFLVWRIVLVSLLFLGGIFASFQWAVHAGLGEAAARTLAVNTLVAMEVFYLFSVRYLDSASITLQGVLGTRAVWIVIVLIVLLQWLFTYAPFMQSMFLTAPLDWSTLAIAPAAGVIVLLVLELEKRVRHPRPGLART
ncbi:cation-translocating P-type ATPase [Halopseudomonas salina]|uniref:Cation-transporting P-type ATPase n=1 Tax=Halopseudomonas salina TaxID=1323744 RepID=A0ABQ1NTE4_9GAMM|nr:HAD-IC family P-type ATPase [Halopseudomonas salina]GGC84885.1 cation-transporting P-type ATPase [Halopseudomonas salina]